jgi:hypothetical protein
LPLHLFASYCMLSVLCLHFHFQTKITISIPALITVLYDFISFALPDTETSEPNPILMFCTFVESINFSIPLKSCLRHVSLMFLAQYLLWFYIWANDSVCFPLLPSQKAKFWELVCLKTQNSKGQTEWMWRGKSQHDFMDDTFWIFVPLKPMDCLFFHSYMPNIQRKVQSYLS